MFLFHIALALNLLALTAGCALYMFSSSRCDCKGACFAKMVAILVILFSIVSTVCTINAGLQAWQGRTCTEAAATTDPQNSATTTPAEKAPAAKAKPAAKKH